jgi:hypothetical protein
MHNTIHLWQRCKTAALCRHCQQRHYHLHHFSLFCFSGARAVVVETVISDEKTTTHFPTIPGLTEDSVIKSLLLVVQQKQPEAHLTLYLDCHHHGSLATPRTLRQMFQRSKRLHVVSFFCCGIPIYLTPKYAREKRGRELLLPLRCKDQYPI